MEIDEDNHNDIVAQFVSVTGAPPEFAQSFLSSADWNLEVAVNSYLGGGQPSPVSTQTQNINSSNISDKERKIQEATRRIMQEQNVDEFTARAIAEVQSENAAPEVRAPIAPTTARLVERAPAETYINNLARDHLLLRERMRNEGVLDSQNFSGDNETSLQGLFSVPRDLMFNGDWEQIKRYGSDLGKWILLNIQKDSEFASFTLNRDLWSNDVVQELVRNNFLLFLKEESHPEAERIKTYYKPTEFPYVAIIDPFTGEEMLVLKLIDYISDANDLVANFVERVGNFLERLNTQSAIVQSDEVVDLVSDDENETWPKETAAVEEEEMEEEEVFSEIEDEPEKGNGITVLQIRPISGKPVKRRFKKDASIADVFKFVRKYSQIPTSENIDLVMFPNKSLSELKDSSLQDAKVLNVSLRCVKKV
eukprot:maker-scaffold_12-snap-gene-10.55-mRNA-1 protein AED:0.06 eAED:0.06 QI:99/0.88/0.9/1/0.44/0.3/10/579/421